jgi:hypothetical protein
MTRQNQDYPQLLRAAIAEAKGVGLNAAATRLEERAFALYTTSSELIGENRAAIQEFLHSAGPALPPGVKAKLRQCLKLLGKG